MGIEVHVPTPLRRLTQGQARVEIEGPSVGRLIDNLDAAYPGLGAKLRNDDGSVRRYINIYVNGDDIRFLEGMDTALRDGDRIAIVPAIAGGAGIQDATDSALRGHR